MRGQKLKELMLFAAYKDIDKEIDWQADEYYKDKYRVYVAESDGKLVGYIAGTVKLKEDKVLDRAGYIDNWYMADEHRNNGVGKQLWKKLEDYFREQKCNHLLLDIWAENDSAHQMYEHMGFIEEQINLVKLLT